MLLIAASPKPEFPGGGIIDGVDASKLGLWEQCDLSHPLRRGKTETIKIDGTGITIPPDTGPSESI